LFDWNHRSNKFLKIVLDFSERFRHNVFIGSAIDAKPKNFLENEMLQAAEVVEIYAQYNVDVSEKEANADIAWAMQDAPSYDALVKRIHGYAKQQALESYASGKEAAEFEENYR
jgi:hypothetical protein